MTPAASPPQIFDRARIRRRRSRAAPRFAAHDFLHRRTMADIVDRLETVTRSFDSALFYGAGELTNMLTEASGVRRLISADCAPARLPGGDVAFDEERIPFAPNQFDLVVSLLTLHSTNDLVGALSQYRTILRPDGLFIAALFSEDTLGALKHALIVAESETIGGASVRVAPFATLKDLGAALQRAGFALPVVDVDRIAVEYSDPVRLFEDLRGMGETAGLRSANRPLRRDVLARTLEELGRAGAPARFDIAYLTGWAPHPDQPKALRPGAAKHSLSDAINRPRR